MRITPINSTIFGKLQIRSNFQKVNSSILNKKDLDVLNQLNTTLAEISQKTKGDTVYADFENYGCTSKINITDQALQNLGSCYINWRAPKEEQIKSLRDFGHNCQVANIQNLEQVYDNFAKNSGIYW